MASFYITRGQTTWVRGNNWFGPVLAVGTVVCLLLWGTGSVRSLVQFIRAKIRGERVYLANVKRLRGSRLDLLTGTSLTIRPEGDGWFSATTIGVRNAETGLSNCCESVQASLHFQHIHIEGQEFTKEAWFVRGENQELNEAAVRRVDLHDGASAQIVLFVSGPRGMAHYQTSFYVLNEAVFHPAFQPALALGEWYVTITVQGKQETDRAVAKVHLKLLRNGSTSMGVVRP